MAISVVFTPPSMAADAYDEIMRRLEAAGAGAPEGRLYHVCYGELGRLRVTDVWDTPEQFERFGKVLMPILRDVGVDPGTPAIAPVHNTVAG
jgi:hypothetical protein